MPATFGERCSAVVLATTMRSMVAASTPPLARACSAAWSAMSGTDSSSPARRRVTIPVRVRIHSSLVSTIVASSSLATTRAGWKWPTAIVCEPPGPFPVTIGAP